MAFWGSIVEENRGGPREEKVESAGGLKAARFTQLIAPGGMAALDK